MRTSHKIHFQKSTNMEKVASTSIDLVVTSPPYPMIEMWDNQFANQNPEIAIALSEQKGALAFDQMHLMLEKVWDEVYRVLREGSIACINAGDATRKIGKDFQLYPNHVRIVNYCKSLGFQVLPCILWRKPTNAPNKFMGSGMLPPGAYVTLEHEYILILRKGGKRIFKSEEEKKRRRKSAFFWEERNLWFSDIWADLRGVGQKIIRNKSALRKRSGAFPLELASRLINMFSIHEDDVLDPFLGTGTTTLAAMIGGRNSIGYELEPGFKEIIRDTVEKVVDLSRDLLKTRIENHLKFVKTKTSKNRDFKYLNTYFKIPVLTKQEIDLRFPEVKKLRKITNSTFEVEYSNKILKNYRNSHKNVKEGLNQFVR